MPALPPGVLWSSSPSVLRLRALMRTACFCVSLGLLIDSLAVVTLGQLFRGSGSQPVFNPSCRSDNARMDHRPLDIVIFWRNTTAGGPGGGVGESDRRGSTALPGADRNLAYTLRSLEAYRLARRARKIHIVFRAEGPHGYPSYLQPAHPKLSFIPHTQLLGPGAAPSAGLEAAQLGLHRIPDLAEWILVLPLGNVRPSLGPSPFPAHKE